MSIDNTPATEQISAVVKTPLAAETPATQGITTAKRGQRIIQGDCIEVMKKLPANAVNFVLTDPPYLVNYVDRAGRRVANDITAEWLKPAFEQVYRVMKNDSFCVSFYGWSKVDLFMQAWRAAGFKIAGHFTFPKRYTSSSGKVRYQHENAYLLMKGRNAEAQAMIGDVIDWTYSGNHLHPTQKPLGVLIPLIEAFSRPKDIVFDPFAGSGSTCAAAALLKRRYLGIELDEKNHAIASARLENYTERG
jgi:adenine-specific DNA-methyltransferase